MSGKHYTWATLMKKAILLNEATIRLHAVQYKKRVNFFSQEGIPKLAKHIHNETSCTPGDKQSPKTIEKVEGKKKHLQLTESPWIVLVELQLWAAMLLIPPASFIIVRSEEEVGGHAESIVLANTLVRAQLIVCFLHPVCLHSVRALQ